MRFIELNIQGCYALTSEDYREDERGFFTQLFCHKQLKWTYPSIDFNINEINIVNTKKKGTIRGLHYQISPHEETKVVMSLQGFIQYVILDLRKGSPTYHRIVSTLVTPIGFKGSSSLLYIPGGCAHGYLSLTNDVYIMYFTSGEYHQESERGIRWDDPHFNFCWKINKKLTISEKDKNFLPFKEENKVE
jgi:dTDP-4-dehydrorhamnose 3,5-epimerase